MKSLVQVCLPERVGQSGMPSVFKSLVQVCLPRSIGQKGMIHLVRAKCDEITCTSTPA